MACPMFNTEELPEPMRIYCHLEPQDFGEVWIKIQNFSFTKMLFENGISKILVIS